MITTIKKTMTAIENKDYHESAKLRRHEKGIARRFSQIDTDKELK